MNPQTQTLIDTALAAAEKATAGPWKQIVDDTGGSFTGWPSVVAPEKLDTTVVHRAGFRQEHWSDTTEKQAVANAAFIALSRTALPRLARIAQAALGALEALPCRYINHRTARGLGCGGPDCGKCTVLARCRDSRE